MVHIFIWVVIALIIASIVAAVRGSDRYATMSEQEFEAEAQRGSPVGNALMEMQKIVGGGQKVEYMLKQDKREEGDSAESGGEPPEGS